MLLIKGDKGQLKTSAKGGSENFSSPIFHLSGSLKSSKRHGRKYFPISVLDVSLRR